MLYIALTPILGIAIVYIGLFIYAYAFSDRIIFPYVTPSYEESDEIFFLESEHGARIASTLLKAENAQTLLLYSHGNGEDIGDIRPFLENFRKNNISVLTYDYPGYGLSLGKASEENTYAAMQAAYQYATESLGYRTENIVLYGRSLGSGPSCWLAAQHHFSGMILDGGFSSTFRVVTKKKLLPWDKFDNLKRLPSINCPILLIHGTADKTVPFSHAQANYNAIKGPKQKLWIENAGHNDLIDLANDQYWKTVLSFIQSSQPSAE